MRSNKQASDKGENKKWKIYGMAGIILLIIIFLLSSQEGDASRSLSRGVAAKVAAVLEALADFLPGVENENVDFFKRVNRYVRQTAHFLEYVLLSFVVGQMIWYKRKLWQESSVLRKLRKLLAGYITVTVIAALDEWHQMFIPGRTSQIPDFLINWAGITIGFGFIAIVHFLGGLYVFKKKTGR